MPFLIVGLGGFAQAHGTIIQTSGDPKAGAGTKHIGINKHAVAAPIAQAGHVKAGSHKAGSASNVEAFDQILADRARHGVDRVVFFSAPATGVTGAVEDAERTKAALDYADALSHGRVDPASLHGVYTVPGQRPTSPQGSHAHSPRETSLHGSIACRRRIPSINFSPLPTSRSTRRRRSRSQGRPFHQA
jgi:hypothetical protein